MYGEITHGVAVTVKFSHYFKPFIRGVVLQQTCYYMEVL